MSETGGTSSQSWDTWFKEETQYIDNLTFSWRIFLFIFRCFLWVIIGVGIFGPRFFEDDFDRMKFYFVFFVLLVFYSGVWLIGKLERSLSYPIRRASSACLTLICFTLFLYMFYAHRRYFGYTVACYFVGASISFASLLCNVSCVTYFYKIHDYVVGHFLFFFLYILSIVQLGVLQTWLLYHNALSSGVAIDDILKYASKKKESDVNEDTVLELRQQIADQERTIKQLLSTVRMDSSSDVSERTALLSSSVKGYGGPSSSAADSLSAIPPAAAAATTNINAMRQSNKTAFSTPTNEVPKSALKQTSAFQAPSTRTKSVGFLSSLDDSDASKYGITEFSQGIKTGETGTGMKTISAGDFSFKQPSTFPKR